MVRIHLARLLAEKKWTRKKLADITGIRPSTIGELYHDWAERMSFDHLDLICEALNCDIPDIIQRVENSEPRVKSKNGRPLCK